MFIVPLLFVYGWVAVTVTRRQRPVGRLHRGCRSALSFRQLEKDRATAGTACASAAACDAAGRRGRGEKRSSASISRLFRWSVA